MTRVHVCKGIFFSLSLMISYRYPSMNSYESIDLDFLLPVNNMKKELLFVHNNVHCLALKGFWNLQPGIRCLKLWNQARHRKSLAKGDWGKTTQIMFVIGTFQSMQILSQFTRWASSYYSSLRKDARVWSWHFYRHVQIDFRVLS